MSNFYPVEITLDGLIWPSVEHYYQGQKTKDLKVRSEIQAASTAFKSKKLGRKIIPDSAWKYEKVSVMIKALVAKFSNPELKAKLLETQNLTIIENSPNDAYWGIGKDGMGFNMLGKCLMLVRTYYQESLQSPIAEMKDLSPQGSFAAVRKFDVHTGIDLYCAEETAVKAMAAGRVYAISKFTGPSAGSPWWQDTQAVIIEHEFGFILYGEIATNLKIGDEIKAGDEVGKVKQVLIKDKGLPMTMLHLEWYQDKVEDGVVWELNQESPNKLLDPTILIELIK